MAVTPDVDYFTLAGVVGAMVGDGADEDKNPDWATATEGTVTFTPTVGLVHVTDTTSGKTVAMVPFPIVCTIDAQGRISYNGDLTVTLLDLGSSKVNPSIPRDKAAYNVSFAGVKMDGASVKLASFGINPSTADAGGDGSIVLWDLQPLPTGTGGAAIARGQGVPAITTAAAGDVVTYDGTDIKWAAPTGGGGSASWDTLTGKPAVIAAGADQATARAAIGAGTSSLVLGTSSTTALAGDTAIPAAPADIGAATAAQGAKADSAVQPGDLATVATSGSYNDLADKPSSTPTAWADVTGKPAVIAAGATQGDARTAIGAGTSSFSGAYTDLTGKPSIPATAADVGAVPTTRTVAGKALSADVTLAKSDVGLGNVDNTADANKAVLSATKLATARTIAGKSFDGTANITLAASDVSAVPTTRTVNGKALSANVTLAASDVSAVPTTRSVNGKALSSDVSLTASDVGAAPYSLASGATGIRFIGAGATLPGTATAGDVFLKTS